MKSNHQINIPEAKAGMEQFKLQAANEVGVNLNKGYNGDLTSREAGSVGGQMVKNMSTIKKQNFIRKNRSVSNHEVIVHYISDIVI